MNRNAMKTKYIDFDHPSIEEIINSMHTALKRNEDYAGLNAQRLDELIISSLPSHLYDVVGYDDLDTPQELRIASMAVLAFIDRVPEASQYIHNFFIDRFQLASEDELESWGFQTEIYYEQEPALI